MTNICLICGSDNYYANGLCKKCYSKNYRQKKSGMIKKYYHNNRNKILQYLKDYHRMSRQKNGGLSMSENRHCPTFLGCHVAERVLRHVFKDVNVMPFNNPGYDFICNSGKKIDVKSSCLHYREHKRPGWSFNIKHNKIADYFLLLAFDNREKLTPLYIWLIPSQDVNHHQNICANIDTYPKWDKYILNIDKVSACCDMIKNAPKEPVPAQIIRW